MHEDSSPSTRIFWPCLAHNLAEYSMEAACMFSTLIPSPHKAAPLLAHATRILYACVPSSHAWPIPQGCTLFFFKKKKSNLNSSMQFEILGLQALPSPILITLIPLDSS